MPKADEESPLLLHFRLLNPTSDERNDGDGESATVVDGESATAVNVQRSLDAVTEDNRIARTVSDPVSDPVSESWKEYNKNLDKNPLLLKCVTAFFVLGLGDLCGQGVEHLLGTSIAEGGVDWIRAVRFGLFGLVGAPWAHYYFYYLDYYLPPTENPFSLVTALKLFIDQGLQAPALLALIISALAILEGDGFEGVKQDMTESYWDALIANWKLWIPASLINLCFVKPSLRVLYVNVVFFIWTIILSVMLNEVHQ
mmetsp:Transcript_5377/g.7030  ORF Transcript_5377/g.7030 Transcript_5377/m.7030 type:complete len:255 (+) Transcript_5377:111-875(+)